MVSNPDWGTCSAAIWQRLGPYPTSIYAPHIFNSDAEVSFEIASVSRKAYSEGDSFFVIVYEHVIPTLKTDTLGRLSLRCTQGRAMPSPCVVGKNGIEPGSRAFGILLDKAGFAA
jgi:hypothetical protein